MPCSGCSTSAWSVRLSAGGRENAEDRCHLAPQTIRSGQGGCRVNSGELSPWGRAEKASQRKAGSEGRAEVDSVVSVRQRGAKSVWREGTAHTGSLRLEGDTISIGGGEGPGRAGFGLEVGEASLGLLSSF